MFLHSQQRSIRHKIHELNHYLKNTMVSILAVSETWLGPSIPDCMVTIPGFQPPLRRDRNENGGGVCFYIHTNLS